MNQSELNDLIKQLGISSDQVLREEAEMEFLEKLAREKISVKLVFYGGTALRLAYNSPRFSEDIDLLDYAKLLKFSEFKNFIEKAVSENGQWKLKDIKDKRNTFFALVIITDEKLKHNFSLKVEVHKPKRKIALKKDLRIIQSPTSISNPLLLVPALNELKKMKEDALVGRKKARDIFDLWYIAQVLRENFILPEKNIHFSSQEFKNELQVFLPKKYYAVIDELYDKISRKN
jgi:predicted nucleotidyltransferase component of viral defense system